MILIQAAQAAFARDISSGVVIPSGTGASSSQVAPPIPKPVLAKPSNPFANYSTAESLGFVDEDAEKYAAEFAIRQKQGQAGEWSNVSVVHTETSTPASIVGFKRERTPPLPVDVPEEEDTRSFKVKQKTAGVGLGELWEPGVIRVKNRQTDDITHKEEFLDPPSGSSRPEWQTTQWKRRDDQLETATRTNLEPSQIKIEDTPVNPTTDPLPSALPSAEDAEIDVKPLIPSLNQQEPQVPAPAEVVGSLFKKRKITSNPNKGKRKL